MTDSHRIALYARVSTRDKNQDVENQLAQLREFARRQGWQITAEYIDQASAKNGQRSELQRMFRAASRREFDHLLFWSLDRLSREGVKPHSGVSGATDRLGRGLAFLYGAVSRFLWHLQGCGDLDSGDGGEAGTGPHQ